jgi:hypothetical protein
MHTRKSQPAGLRPIIQANPLAAEHFQPDGIIANHNGWTASGSWPFQRTEMRRLLPALDQPWMRPPTLSGRVVIVILLELEQAAFPLLTALAPISASA